MKSVRSALRKGDLDKDTYGRLSCVSCETSLKTRDDPDRVGSVRFCPDCDREWKELG
jgi:hypothetical protein